MNDWYESGSVQDVTIRDCDFTNSAYAGGAAIVCAPRLRAVDYTGAFNGQIVMENNLFCQSTKRIASIRLADRVIFRNNRFRTDPTLPVHKALGEDGTSFTFCATLDYTPAEEI